MTVNQSLSTIIVSPANAALNENQTQPFSAIGYDQFGATLTLQPSITWSMASGVGSIDGSGLYTAGTVAGAATVTATSGSVAGGASVTVINAAPTVATPAAASPNPITGTSTSLSVLGSDDGGEANLTYTWIVTAEPAAAANPTFSGNGNNTAKDTTATFFQAGNYAFMVTITDAGGLTTTSSVGAMVNQTLDHRSPIRLRPAQPQSQRYARRSPPSAMTSWARLLTLVQPSFTWDIASGVGSIDGFRTVCTAGTVAGSATITATSGAVSGGATVTVTNAAPTVASPAAATPDPITGTSTCLSVLGVATTAERRTSPIPAGHVSAEPAGCPSTTTFSGNGNLTRPRNTTASPSTRRAATPSW